jgi:two-component system, OmpR family, aerobic respiration control sensor histidine kinase ArcB
MMKRKPILEKINTIPDCQLVLKSLMLNFPGHVYFKDLNGVYLGCNDRQAQSLGLTIGEEVVGKTDFELPWQDELASHFWENDRQVILSGESKSVEELAIVNGKEAIVWSLKVPLKTSENKIVGLLGISIDISKQKRFEAKLIHAKETQEAAIQMKTRFLANMKHDIRTPIAGIRGCIQVIKDALDVKDMEKASEYLADLDTSSQALLTLLNAVLEKLQATHGTLPIQKSRFDLQAMLVEVLHLNQARAKQKGLLFSVQHDENISDLIGDPDRIERIVLELVANALNFTEQGEVRVISELARQCKDRSIIKIIVEDTGRGFPLEKQLNIFTSSTHLHPSYSGSSLGTGLGLKLIKQLMDDLEGELYLESTPGRGSRFTCVLPLKEALLRPDETSTCNQKIQIKVESALNKNGAVDKIRWPARVLLIEDAQIVAKVTKVLLTKLGCTVDLAYNAHSARTLLNEQLYDLIFLDIGLPNGNGNEVAQETRQNNQCPNQATPIVAVTAHVDEKSKKESLLAGINAVLSKPLLEAEIKVVLKIFVQD